MTFKYLIRTIIVLLFINVSVWAQTKSISKGTMVFRTPDAYKFPDGTELNDHANADKDNTIWTVYTIRNDVQAFDNPNTAIVARTLKFMTPAWVIGEKGDYLNLMEYNPAVPIDSKWKIGAEGTSIGWVKKKDLLLWSSSLVAKNTFVYLKALTVVSDLSVLKDLARYINSYNGEIKLYYDPPRTQVIQDKSLRLFQYIFISKMYISNNDTSYLLCKTNSITGRNCEDKILGWISSGLIKKWANCICIEPNQDANAIQERKQKTMNACIVGSTGEAIKFQSGTYPTDPLWKEDDSYKKLTSYDFRSPVIHQDNEGVITTGFTTDIISKSGQKIIGNSDRPLIDKNTAEILALAKKVNIVFVVDGSEEMGTYNETILKAIQKALDNIGISSEYQYKYGFVVYRDKSYKDCNADIVASSGLNSSVSSFLFNIKKELSAKYQCSEKSPYQPVFEAIMNGTRLFTERYESNILILVGSASNDPNDSQYTRSKVEEKLAQYGVTFSAIQANNGYAPEFEQFVTDARDIIKNSSSMLNDDINKTLELVNQKKDFKKPVFSARNTTGTVWSINVPNDGPVNDYLLFPLEGSSMRVDEVEIALDSLVLNADRSIRMAVDGVINIIKGFETAGKAGFNPLIAKIFKNAVDFNKLDPSTINKYASENFQFFVQGYTTMSSKKLTYPIYSYTLLLTGSELDKILESYQRFGSGGNSDQQRQDVVEAFKQTLITYKGGSVDPKLLADMLKKKPAEVLTMITGLPVKNELLTKYSIDDLNNVKKVSDNNINTIANLLYEVSGKLEKIKNDKSNAKDALDGYFYWVSSNIFP